MAASIRLNQRSFARSRLCAFYPLANVSCSAIKNNLLSRLEADAHMCTIKFSVVVRESTETFSLLLNKCVFNELGALLNGS